jgi:photosystem II stability/assembly factor-like uncharacterized protein
MTRNLYHFSLLGLLLLSTTLWGQKKRNVPAPSPMPAVSTNAFDAKTYAGLKWRNIGPFRGGRSNAVSGVKQNENLYYCGYTGGGLWKTEDAGLNWRNISDGQFKSTTIGDIAVAESDPNVIYVGTGEHAVRGVMTTYGDGVYKSIDAGKTWKNIGLEKTRHISDVVVHPNNPDLVYVAAQGALHGPSEDRGVYKSTDGGTTWKKVLFVDENSGASSLSMDHSNPRILYAATWQHRRTPWKVESGGPGSMIWKSTDGGESWKKINEGLPKELGKIGVSVSPVNPNRVFAIVEAEKTKAGLYRSDNGGESWTLLSSDQNINSRSWYYMEVFADPVNADVVYVLNAPMTRSIDGGRTFSTIRVGHGDTHDLWINPNNNQNIILGDDGGGEVTFNAGRSWSTQGNQPTAQFYRVNTDNLFPYRVYGGQQDNTSVVITSRTNTNGITQNDWFEGPGCESAYIAFDANNPELLLGGCYQGIIEALNTRTRESKDVMAYSALNLANPPKRMKYRFNWNAPIVSSPHDAKVIYHTGNVVFRTRDAGLTWEKISPDLTRNDTTKQDIGGGPMTNEGAGGENYNTIYYLIESSLEKGVIYTGSDCGLVYLTQDDGRSWNNITPKDLQECMIQSIEVSPHDRGTAYICATRYKFNDFTSYTYKTTDYGKTWTKIATGIDNDDFIKVIREDKMVKGLLYSGAERGFYISTDGGVQWNRLQLNLPIVPVTDLQIRNNDLVASTAGRAFWILDDLGAMQQAKGVVGTAVAQLFKPQASRRFSGGSAYLSGDAPAGIGMNPAEGVIFDYYLKEKADTNLLRIEVLDAAGKVIRKLSNKKDESFKPYPGGPSPEPVLPAEAGVNRFAWDFRTDGLVDVPGVFIYGDYRGYRVAPGQYKIRLTHRGQVSEQMVDVLPDSRVNVSAADWQAQQVMLQTLGDQINEIHRTVVQVRKIRKQLDAYNEVLKDNKAAADLLKKGQDLVKKINDFESLLVEPRTKNGQDVINWPSKLSAELFTVRGRVDAHDPRITQGNRERHADLTAEWNSHQQALQALRKEIQAYNLEFKNQNIPALVE